MKTCPIAKITNVDVKIDKDFWNFGESGHIDLLRVANEKGITTIICQRL